MWTSVTAMLVVYSSAALKIMIRLETGITHVHELVRAQNVGCCNCQIAEHSWPDLPHIFVYGIMIYGLSCSCCRMAEAADGDAEDNRAPTQIAILDLAWAGTEGKTRYPPFVNPKALRNIKQVDGQLIMQEHDREQLGLNLDRLRTQERNHRDRLSRMAAA